MKPTKVTQAKPPVIDLLAKETKQESFDRHFVRCFLQVGDRVVFKKPKRRRIYGTVDYIERNIDQMFWSDGGQPKYLRIAVENKDDKGEILGYTHVWVNESKVVFQPPERA